jgi:hypothetical protein
MLLEAIMDQHKATSTSKKDKKEKGKKTMAVSTGICAYRLEIQCSV